MGRRRSEGSFIPDNALEPQGDAADLAVGDSLDKMFQDQEEDEDPENDREPDFGF